MNNPNKPIENQKSWLKHFGPAMLMGASLIVLAATVPTVFGAPQLNYTFRTVDAPNKDLANSFLITWNNGSGLVIQQYIGTDGLMHTAALLSSGWTIIDVPGALGTGSSNPNSQGEVALTYWGTDGIYHLAIWRMGHYTYVPDLWPGFGVQGINDRGQMSGAVMDSSGSTLAFVGDSRQHEVFAFPGSDATIAFMTSDCGITVGQYLGSGSRWWGFCYDGTHFTTLAVPGAIGVGGTFVNNQGDILGTYFASSGNCRGFLVQRGNMTTFDVPNAIQTAPYSITDNHMISGAYQAVDGTWHGFVATPNRGK